MGDITVPSRRDRAISSAVSAFAAIGLYLVTSILLGLVTVFVFAREGLGLAAGAQAGGADVMRAAAATVDAQVPAWASWGVVLASALVAWLGSARVGLGMIGDPVGSMKALGPDGERATRGRTLLRAGVPVAIGLLGLTLGLGPTVLFVLFVCACVATYREDRRGPFELIAKVHLASTSAVQIDRDTWREQQRATKAPASADE